VKIYKIDRDESAFQQPVNEHDLQIQLTHELALEKIIEVVELKAGLFNNTYRVDTEQNCYILKVAPWRGADVFYNELNLMRRERSISRQLQSLSPLIPEYLSFFKVGDRDAFLQPYIKGRLWHDHIHSLSDLENNELWKQLGQFSKILHNCSGEKFGYPAPYKGFSRWSRFIADNVGGMVNDCHRLDVFCEEIELYCSYLPRFYPILDDVKSPKLLHGDLWPKNIIFDGTGSDIHIKAVLDAERAYWGDPVSEWVFIFYNLPDTFWQGYGENLLKTGNPTCIEIYKGMYFILNILESVRFHESDEEPRKRLALVNKELDKLLHSI